MSQELLTNVNWIQRSGTGTYVKTSDGITLNGGLIWVVASDFIPLPTGNNIIYEYDFDVSVTANNTIYIQIERYNINKGTISNNAATNCISAYKPTTDTSHARFKGTISLATFDNPAQNTAFIKIRTCNGYNSTTGTYTLHSWSLKAINNDRQNISTNKNGQLLSDSLRENYNNVSFNKSGLIEGQHIYEY